MEQKQLRVAEILAEILVEISKEYGNEEVMTLRENIRGIVRVLRILPNDQIVGGDDNTLKVWDLKTGHCLKTLTGHTSHIHALAVLRNGQVDLATIF